MNLCPEVSIELACDSYVGRIEVSLVIENHNFNKPEKLDWD